MRKVSLESILRKRFGCKRPVLKKPYKYTTDGVENEWYLTVSGGKAYEKLVSLIYDLDDLTDGDYKLYDLVDDLDLIVDKQVSGLEDDDL